MSTQNHYTFGDNARAADRLLRLARVFEQRSRELIERFAPPGLALAIDLGAGPGHTTRLLHEASRAQRTIGVEASDRYLEQARAHAPPGVELVQEDITRPSGDVPQGGLVFCRFVLTHVSDPGATIRGLRRYVVAGGLLLLQETSHLDASHPALARYYELVGQMQSHYGQRLHIGRELAELAHDAPFDVVAGGIRRFERAASAMATLHAQNIATWKTDAFAQRHFDPVELAELERRLTDIANGAEPAGDVRVGLGELVLRAS